MFLNYTRLSAYVTYILLLTYVSAVPSQPQQVLAETILPKVGVRGRNSAYYTQVAKEDQLFNVRYLVAYPDKPAINEHIFVYLSGHISENYPGLRDATFKLSGACPEYYEEEHKIIEWKRPIVRHGARYGGPLAFGPNELLFDSLMLLWPPYKPAKWNCSAEVTARLPDQRVLFSFAQNFTLEWPKVGDDFMQEANKMEEELQRREYSEVIDW